MPRPSSRMEIEPSDVNHHFPIQMIAVPCQMSSSDGIIEHQFADPMMQRPLIRAANIHTRLLRTSLETLEFPELGTIVCFGQIGAGL